MRARAKNQLQAVLHQEGFQKPVADLFGKRGRAGLAGLELSPAARRTVGVWLRQIDHLDEEIAVQKQELERMAARHSPAARAWYVRLKQRKPAQVALIALARKLLAAVWALLRHGVCFEERRFAG